jgi:glucose/arabinose dehydrogenase
MSQRLKYGALVTSIVAVGLTIGVVGGQPVPTAAPATIPPAGQSKVVGAFAVRTIADGLESPWSLAFLPDGSMFVTERAGRLRIIRNGMLDPKPIAGLPDIYVVRITGLMDVAVHPRFAENGFVYLTYTKLGPPLPAGEAPMATRFELPYSIGGRPLPGTGKTSTVALARGRWNGTSLVDVKDIFVADDYQDDSLTQTSASRIVFGTDGLLYMSIGAPNAPAYSGPYTRIQGGRAQDPTSHGGKIVRLRDDGSVPPDNPYVGKNGYKPEIFTMGHRNSLGLTVHPQTGAIWEHENGPQDGDEVNILKAGANYGWPLVGMGRDYAGDYIGGRGSIGGPTARPDASSMFMAGMEQPFVFWTPAVAPSGMAVYTGDRFPTWKGSLLIGVMKYRRLERHVFNDKGWVVRREYYFEDLKQRIRDVRQGPDGFVYLVTDHSPGAVLRIEPAP